MIAAQATAGAAVNQTGLDTWRIMWYNSGDKGKRVPTYLARQEPVYLAACVPVLFALRNIGILATGRQVRGFLFLEDGMANVALLEISHWDIGGGVHFYGVLRCGGKRVDVTRELGEDDANRLNYYDRTATYVAGDVSTRFLIKQAVIDRAIAMYKTAMPEAMALLRGEAVFKCAGIIPVVDAPAEQMELLNALYELDRIAVKVKAWDESDKIIKQWQGLFVRFGWALPE